MRQVRENLFLSFVYNVAAVPLAAGVLYPFRVAAHADRGTWSMPSSLPSASAGEGLPPVSAQFIQCGRRGLLDEIGNGNESGRLAIHADEDGGGAVRPLRFGGRVERRTSMPCSDRNLAAPLISFYRLSGRLSSFHPMRTVVARSHESTRSPAPAPELWSYRFVMWLPAPGRAPSPTLLQPMSLDWTVCNYT
jgi:hypothetical protein